MNNDKGINILIVGMSTYYGGTEAFIMTLFRNIDKNKYHFLFLNAYDEPIVCSDEIIFLGGEILHLRLRRRQDGLKKYKEGIKDFFLKNNDKIDIVLQNIQDLINIDIVKYAHIYNKKTILWGHACDYGVKPRFLTRMSAFYNKLTYRKYADLLVANSSKSGDWLYGNNYIVVENFIDTSRFKYNKEDRKIIREKYHIDDNEVVFGTLGRLSIEKNQLFLIDVFSKIHSCNNKTKLMFVGSGDMLEQLQNRVKEYKLEDSVLFVGKTNESEKYYSAFDVFVFPSRFEGFGISLLEAECSSLPCVVSDVIPNEAIKSNMVTKLPINDIDVWVSSLLSIKLNNKREDNSIVDTIEKNNGYLPQTIKICKIFDKLYGK